MEPSETARPETRLADFAAQLAFEDIPEGVRHEARRSLINIFATALAGSQEPAIDVVLHAMRPFSGPRTSTVIGRPECGDAALAAFVNAMSANIFDYDDTHEATIIHPAATVFSALFAHAELARCTGAAVLRSFVVGGEIECRIGNAMSPYHYARGWHITSTCGVFGAAAGTGALLGLTPTQMLHALSAAAVQSSGLVEALGTMAKSISVGGAARNGLLSAVLAKSGLSGPPSPLTGERGYLRVYADPPRPEALLNGLGTDWEIAANTYKPYPVGVVLNPVIEAFLTLREQQRLKLDDVISIEATGHPLLRQRTDRPDVATGRESQVSAQHAIAIVLLRGRAELDEFSDDAAAETLRAGRPMIQFRDDPAREIASVALEIQTRKNGTLRHEISSAIGSRSNPLSDERLEAKLFEAARRSGFVGDVRRLADTIWRIDQIEDAGDVVRLAAG
jgi:2-methylcitrate dehydratase PrpD